MLRGVALTVFAVSVAGAMASGCDGEAIPPVQTGAGGSGGSGGAGEGGSADACEAPLVLCGSACADVRYDPAHCGACDSACAAGVACFEGVCAAGMGVDGDHCDGASDCSGGVCLTEADTGLAKGMCTELCNDAFGVACTSANSICLSAGVCARLCTANGDCPQPSVCSEISDDGTSVCISKCGSDADCPALGKCNLESAFCEKPEDCGNALDDDDDSLVDCEDDECTASCAASIGSACMGAAALMSGSAMGSTSGGTQLFLGTCTGGGGAKEQLYTLTSMTSAVTVVTLDSATDQGFYIRKTCSDTTTELACADGVEGGALESTVFLPDASTTYTVIVDGYSAGESGPFELATTTLTTVAETEDNGTLASADLVTEAVTAQVGMAGDKDWFTIMLLGKSVLAVQTLGAKMDPCDNYASMGSGTDTELEIVSVDPGTTMTTQLAFNDDISGDGAGNFCSRAEVTVEPGTYFVRISASQEYCKDCTFDYAAAFFVTPAN